MKLKRIFSVLASIAMLLPNFAAATSPVAMDPVGTNYVDSSGTVYMITAENGQTVRRPYTSAGAFLSYGFNSFASLSRNYSNASYPVGSFIPPQDGKVMCSDRGADRGTCYLITESKKAGFVSEAVFKSHGYDFGRAMYGDISFLPSTANIEMAAEAHRPGTLINLNGTVYLVTGNGLLGFSGLSEFNSWGYSFSDVVPANSADAAIQVKNVVPARANGLLNPHTTNNTTTPPASYIPVSLHSSSLSGTITPGTSKDLFRFNIQAPANGSVTLRQLGFDFGGTIPAGSLSNLKLIYNLTNTEVGSNSGNVLNDNSILMNLPSGIGMNNSFIADFTLRADVNSAAAGSAVNARLTQVWIGDGSIASLAPNVAGLPVTGNTLTIGAANPLALVTQTANESWAYGSPRNIQWSGGVPGSAATVYLAQPACNGGVCTTTAYYVARNITNTGSYNWQVASVDVDGKQIPPGSYYVMVETSPQQVARSNGLITLTQGNYLQILSPRTGATWVKGAPSTVTFSASGINGVNVYLIPYYPCLYTAPACSIPQPTPYRVAQNVSTAYSGIGISVGRDIIDNRDIPTGQYLIQITDNSTGLYTDTSPQPITLTN